MRFALLPLALAVRTGLWDISKDPDVLPRDLELEEALARVLREGSGARWARGHALLGALCHFWRPQNRSCAAYRIRIALRLNHHDEVALLAAAAMEADSMPRVFSCPRCKDSRLKKVPHSMTSMESMVWRSLNGTEARRMRRQRLLPLLRAAVQRFPRHGEAKGALAMQLGATKMALELWRQAMDLAPTSRAMVNRAVTQLRFLGRRHLAEQFTQRAADLQLWRSPHQRPHIYWPSLPVAAFPGAEVDPRLPATAQAFQRRSEEFRAELLRQRPQLLHFAGFTPCEAEAECREEDGGLFPENKRFQGFWEAGQLYSKLGGCAEATPKTCGVIQEVLVAAGLQVTSASISAVFGPYTFIPEHSSATQGRLRLHCTLQLPPKSVSLLRLTGRNERRHAAGECFWFDESSDHEASYSSDATQPRVLLMVDVVHPRLQDLEEEPLLSPAPFKARYWKSYLPSSKQLYVSSVLEQDWLLHAMNWTEAPWRMCARLRAKTMARWLEELQASDFSPEIFSVFWRREKSLQWIEPLAATLRHPATHCQGHWQRSASQRGYEFDWKELRTFESKDYLLLSKSAWADKGQRILFDAGVNAYNSSLGWFLDAYARNGILFDRLFGWEVSPPAHFLEQIPAEVAQRLRFSTEPVVSTEAHENNPVALISKLCRPQDFCVFKLDIDEPETERELFGQLIRPGGPVSQGLLDEFFWEDHVDLPAYGLFGGKGTLEESYQRFLLLRARGVRAHAWP
ncbi:unnamed protein product [Effrenium voratum]|uniref:Aspartyl/asparaginy/proline hydroxylase domain-containing protein n=1 Tax=Effrenium voratum TaxID=2562239 RepID=A0AA36J982_9DINO|nr:unnamed protein product [Effrenium voratum]